MKHYWSLNQSKKIPLLLWNGRFITFHKGHSLVLCPFSVVYVVKNP